MLFFKFSKSDCYGWSLPEEWFQIQPMCRSPTDDLYLLYSSKGMKDMAANLLNWWRCKSDICIVANHVCNVTEINNQLDILMLVREADSIPKIGYTNAG